MRVSARLIAALTIGGIGFYLGYMHGRDGSPTSVSTRANAELQKQLNDALSLRDEAERLRQSALIIERWKDFKSCVEQSFDPIELDDYCSERMTEEGWVDPEEQYDRWGPNPEDLDPPYRVR